MEPPFNGQEQRLLRFLKEEFLEKGSKPTTMRSPATMECDVMRKFGLDLPQYREIMARLEHHGIAKAIAIGSTNGHVQIDPMIVEIVRQLDEPDWVERIKRYFFTKRWFAVILIGAAVLHRS